MTADIIRLASQYGRYGYRRIAALLKAEGWHVNVKRVQRIWQREGLKVPPKQPKKGRLWLNDGSCIRLRLCWQIRPAVLMYIRFRYRCGLYKICCLSGAFISAAGLYDL